MSNETESEILTLTIRLPKILRDQMLLHTSGESKQCNIDIHIQNYADSSITHLGRCICLVIDLEPELLIRKNYMDTREIDSLKKQLANAQREIEQLKSRKGQGAVSNTSDSKADSEYSDAEAQSPIALAWRKKSGK